MFDDPRPEQEEALVVQEPQESTSRSMWHGRIARDAQGNRIMWQEPMNGRGGRFVQLSEAVASTQAREALAGERARLATLNRLAPLAQEYVRLGNNTPTGGWRQRSYARELQAQPGDLWNGLNFPTQWMDHDERSRLETMRGLEDEAVRANIQPGQAGTANSIFEQEVLRGMFPNIQALGATNSERATRLFVTRDLQERRVQAAERWLTQNPDLSQFERAWREEEARIRPQLELQYGRQFGTAEGARAGAAAGAAAASPQGAGQAEEWVRNPQTGRLERRR